jgi:prepilin-type N-terminal cleavage/methylation domain-containing protein
MRQQERGFSLVELMIAMTVTLIVSGAIYGLLTSGSTAFRREPELADRQQNIRVAMDLIARDVFNAGAALPTFAQVFTITDPAGGACVSADGVNGCGDAGTLGTAAAGARAPGDGGDASEDTDVIELVSTDEQCPVLSVCNGIDPDDTSVLPEVFVTRESVPACMRLPGLTLLTDGTSFVVRTAQAVTSGAVTCTSGSANNGNLTVGELADGFRPPAAVMLASSTAPWPPVVAPATYLYQARVVRYRIAPSSDPNDPGPALWRSETGRYATDGSAALEPGESGFPGTGSPWELVARGIEDLQIEYMPGDLLWHNLPPASTTGDWTTLVRQVRITLSARAAAANLQGQTTAGGGAPDAVRGQLTTTVAPRAAFQELQMGSQIQ